MWWVRPEGVIILVPLSIIFFMINKKSKSLIPKYIFCIFVFILISSPFLIQRENQFDDPFYFYYNDHLFVDDYATEGLQRPNNSALDFVEKNGTFEFLNTFLINGAGNVIEQTLRLSFPYILILFPFGMLFSLRAFDQESSYIKSNWILFITYAAFMIIPLAVINERRFLFALLPFLIIFSVLPIQRVVEYGLSTFSFSKRNKNIFLVIVLVIILLLSSMFMLRYDVKDPVEEFEKMEFSNFLTNDISGLILDSPSHRTFNHGYFTIEKLDNPQENFKKYKMSQPFVTESGNKLSSMKGTTLNEIILDAKIQNAKYLLVDNQDIEPLKKLYENDNSYDYLIKIYDTKEQGMERITIKVFEINYDKFTP